MMSRRRMVADVLESRGDYERIGRWFNASMLILIAANVIALMLETVGSLQARYQMFFDWFERVSVAVFTIEYVMRLWSCSELEGVSPGWRGRLAFAFTPMMIIDLVAIVPFYLPALGVDMRSARAIRLFRVFRVAKMGRYSRTLRTFGRIVRHKRAELLTLLLFLGVFLVIASSVMYFAENSAQPEKFSSIPRTMWWSVVTLTTVGYGDAYPITDIGRLLTSVIAVLGIGVVALPTGLLSAAFVEELQAERKRRTLECPHCGKHIDPGQS